MQRTRYALSSATLEQLRLQVLTSVGQAVDSKDAAKARRLVVRDAPLPVFSDVKKDTRAREALRTLSAACVPSVPRRQQSIEARAAAAKEAEESATAAIRAKRQLSAVERRREEALAEEEGSGRELLGAEEVMAAAAEHLARVVRDPAPLRAIRDASARSVQLRCLRVLPVDSWRVALPADDVTEAEAGISGRVAPSRARWRGTRAGLADVCKGPAAPLKLLPRVLQVAGAPFAVAAVGEGLTTAAIAYRLAAHLEVPVSAFSWSKDDEPQARAIACLGVADEYRDRVSEGLPLKTGAVPGIEARAVAPPEEPAGGAWSRQGTVTSVMLRNVTLPPKLRPVADVAPKERHLGITAANFFGPRFFGFGRTKLYHVQELWLEGAHRDACVALCQWIVDADPDARLAYLRYQKTRAASVLAAPTASPAGAPCWIGFLRQVAELFEGGERDDGAFGKLMRDGGVLPAPLREAVHTAIPHLTWNVALSARLAQHHLAVQQLQSPSAAGAKPPPKAEGVVPEPGDFVARGAHLREVPHDASIFTGHEVPPEHALQAAAATVDSSGSPVEVYSGLRGTGLGLPAGKRLVIPMVPWSRADGAVSGAASAAMSSLRWPRAAWGFFAKAGRATAVRPAELRADVRFVAADEVGIRGGLKLAPPLAGSGSLSDACPQLFEVRKAAAKPSAGASVIALQFALPPGVYASSVLREMCAFVRPELSGARSSARRWLSETAGALLRAEAQAAEAPNAATTGALARLAGGEGDGVLPPSEVERNDAIDGVGDTDPAAGLDDELDDRELREGRKRSSSLQDSVDMGRDVGNLMRLRVEGDDVRTAVDRGHATDDVAKGRQIPRDRRHRSRSNGRDSSSGSKGRKW